MEELWGDFHRLKELVVEMNWWVVLFSFEINVPTALRNSWQR